MQKVIERVYATRYPVSHDRVANLKAILNSIMDFIIDFEEKQTSVRHLMGNGIQQQEKVVEPQTEQKIINGGEEKGMDLIGQLEHIRDMLKDKTSSNAVIDQALKDVVFRTESAKMNEQTKKKILKFVTRKREALEARK